MEEYEEMRKYEDISSGYMIREKEMEYYKNKNKYRECDSGL